MRNEFNGLTANVTVNGVSNVTNVGNAVLEFYQFGTF